MSSLSCILKISPKIFGKFADAIYHLTQGANKAGVTKTFRQMPHDSFSHFGRLLTGASLLNPTEDLSEMSIGDIMLGTVASFFGFGDNDGNRVKVVADLVSTWAFSKNKYLAPIHSVVRITRDLFQGDWVDLAGHGMKNSHSLVRIAESGVGKNLIKVGEQRAALVAAKKPQAEILKVTQSGLVNFNLTLDSLGTKAQNGLHSLGQAVGYFFKPVKQGFTLAMS